MSTKLEERQQVRVMGFITVFEVLYGYGQEKLPSTSWNRAVPCTWHNERGGSPRTLLFAQYVCIVYRH